MSDDRIRILRASDVAELMKRREGEVMDAVGRAYVAHRREQSSLPHSSFLRFPNDDANRIIALPGYLGGGFEVAGIKWIASFPGNVAQGVARASAVVVLNSMQTGRPTALLEGSLISAARTAASAALAARHLCPEPPPVAGLVGTGLINLEVVRFLRAALPELTRFVTYDLDAERAASFARRVEETHPGVEVTAAKSLDDVLAGAPLVSFATTAGTPHVDSLDACPPGATVLHVSLRDLAAEAILAADNVVDDADHVCRAKTSLHLAEQKVGHREFIRCPLADVLTGDAPARAATGGVSVFSPFGLGVLDLAVAHLLLEHAERAGVGTEVEGFLPLGTV